MSKQGDFVIILHISNFVYARGGDVQYLAPEDASVMFKENPKNFSDIEGRWCEPYVNFVTERELFVGTDKNLFSPDKGMTRAMFATVVGRLYERSCGHINALNANTFSDCNYNDYYGKYVDWAAKESILDGYGKGKFGPDDQITREQMAAIIYRFANFLNIVPESMDSSLNFSDSGTVSSWAENAALYCQSANIIAGRDGGEFAPKNTATRADVAVILQNFIENIFE